jgi:hypothetical protein
MTESPNRQGNWPTIHPNLILAKAYSRETFLWYSRETGTFTEEERWQSPSLSVLQLIVLRAIFNNIGHDEIAFEKGKGSVL